MIATLERSPRAFPYFAAAAGVTLTGIAGVAALGIDRLSLGICLFKAMTGLPCLSCGTTRGLGLLARGDLAGALAMNPLFTGGVLLLLLLGAAEAALLLRGRVLRLEPSPATVRAAWVALGVATIVNWIWLLASGR